jgi:hypothetical protein
MQQLFSEFERDSRITIDAAVVDDMALVGRVRHLALDSL